MNWKTFSRFKTIFALAALFSLPFVFLYIKRKSPTLEESITSPILDASLALQSGFSYVISGITDRFYAFAAVFDSHEELVRLRARTGDFLALQISLTELEAENLRLKEAMDFSAKFATGRTIGSHVIGRTGAPLTRVIQIDKGRSDGISRGNAVISANSAVGQVLTAGQYYSDVLLLTDSTSAIDILVQRTRARGLLSGASGSSNYRARVNDFDRLHEVQAGDIIVTSGMGAHFPAGLPVGEVISIKQRPDSLYVEAEVRPYTKFDQLEEVVVLADGGLDKPWSKNELVMETLQKSVIPNSKVAKE